MKDLDKIRNMSDEDLKKFLRSMEKRDTVTCPACGKRGIMIVKVNNTETYQTKTVCSLCKEHYEEFLEHFHILPVMWDE